MTVTGLRLGLCIYVTLRFSNRSSSVLSLLHMEFSVQFILCIRGKKGLVNS